MPRSLWIGFTRGLLLGLIGGLAAGSVEGASLLRHAPVMRTALIEAAIYAVIVDALVIGGLSALAGAALAGVLQVARLKTAPRTIAALFVAGTVAIVLVLAGLLWAYRAHAALSNEALPTPLALSILIVAIGIGVLVYPIARSFAHRLLAHTRRVAVVGITASVALALVLPSQAILEARRHAVETVVSGPALREVDPGVLEEDLFVDLQASLGGAPARGGTANAEKPNLLLITVDALRADHVGACGNTWIQTPSLDLLANHGALSCNAYTQQPQSNPSLASLFTSTYPAVNGVRMHMVDRLSDTFDTLAEILQRSGYVTGGIIPWTSLEPAFSGLHQGFQTYSAFVVNEPALLSNPATAALAGIYRRVTDQLAVGSAVEALLGVQDATESDLDGRADVTTAATINWLANFGDAPFFLWVHYFDPHYPWTAPEPWSELYGQYDGQTYDGSMQTMWAMGEGTFEPSAEDVEYLRATYASEVSYADHYVGQLLGYMAREGLLENTIVVLTADHGESLGDRPEPVGAYWLHGTDLYTAGIQVPIIVYDPRILDQGKVIEPPLQLIDIMPTVLDLLGVPIPQRAQGRSVVPLINGTESGTDRLAISVLSEDEQISIVSADGWKLISDGATAPRPRELYYLPDDPAEANNLLEANGGKVAALSQRLEAWARANQSSLAALSGAETGG
ncbi:MAG: sulfatase-like hydrolase/transferase [Chloroflexi bacterium]|nr:sulfatase-like hydrolase/transferase [Chloroflexota bacterium]